MGVAVLHAPSRRAGLTGRLRRAWTDERLVAHIRAGDEAAFEALYDRYHRDLLAFCRHMLGTREEAEDALQHTFLQAYRILRSDDRPLQPRAWLFAVARNRCLSALRARREHADVDDARVATEGLAAEVQRRDDLRALLADLQRLPEDQRAALLLSELGAHSHDEIAAVLEVRTEKVKALVFQARESLMHFRQGREADCGEIRRQLATLRGGALRRTEIRRHLDVCPGCTQFREEVRRQRAAMAVVLPVVPSVALKGSVLGAVLGGGAAAGGAAAGAAGAAAAGGAASGAVAGVTGGGALSAAGGMAGKALVTLAIAGSAGAGGYVAVDAVKHDGSNVPARRSSPVTPASPAIPARGGTGPAIPATPASPSSALEHRRGAAAPGRERADDRRRDDDDEQRGVGQREDAAAAGERRRGARKSDGSARGATHGKKVSAGSKGKTGSRRSATKPRRVKHANRTAPARRVKPKRSRDAAPTLTVPAPKPKPESKAQSGGRKADETTTTP